MWRSPAMKKVASLYPLGINLEGGQGPAGHDGPKEDESDLAFPNMAKLEV